MDQIHVSPYFLKTFEWTAEDAEDHFDVTFSFPDDFNVDLMKVELTSNNKCVYIGVTSQPPFFAGSFYNRITKYTKVTSKGQIIHRFTKETPEKWPIMLSDPTVDSNLMDPKSLFLSYLYNQSLVEQLSDDETKQMLLNLALSRLEEAAKYYYPPAICEYAKILLSQNNPQLSLMAKQFLSIGARVFNDPPSTFMAGLVDAQMGNISEAIEEFKAAAQSGIVDALNALGEIYSPLQEPRNQFEDAEAAVELFNQVLKIDPNHFFAMYNLCKMYAAGCGVKRDMEKAKSLKEKCAEIGDISMFNFDLEEIAKEYENASKKGETTKESTQKKEEKGIKKDEENPIVNYIISGGINIGVAAAVGYFVYRIIRNKQ